ncbi:hypothetical protein HHX47_DHR7000555 [Lentinula edodes]|nr:hypothetical protein HHX47_DHR7000555 [Lentinula edodes]
MLQKLLPLLYCTLLAYSSSSSVATQNPRLQGPIVDVTYAQFQGAFDPETNVTNFLGIRYATSPTGDLRFRAPQSPTPISGVQQADTEPPECVQGYAGGNGSMYHGSDLLQQANNEVVAVIIQYRLGLFGFLAGKNVKENGDLNAGLLDQHLALQWVNEHALYTEVVSQSNCSSASDTLNCLRAADLNVLRTVNTDIQDAAFSGTFAFVPVIDGNFITQRPTIALKEGKINGRAFLAITNTNEGNDFVDQTGVVMNTSIYAGQLFPKFGSAQDNEVAKQYAGLGTTLNQINNIMGDSIFKCPSFFMLNAFHEHGFNTFKGEFGEIS